MDIKTKLFSICTGLILYLAYKELKKKEEKRKTIAGIRAATLVQIFNFLILLSAGADLYYR